MRHTAIVLCFLLLPTVVLAQVDSARTSVDTLRDDEDRTAGTMLPSDTLIAAPSDGLPSSSRAGTAPVPCDHRRPPLDAASHVWSKDSIALIEYHHLGEIVARQPGVMLAHLGNYGQPVWMGRWGTLPFQSTVLVDGVPADQLPSSVPDPYRFPTEGADRFTVYPQYQAFWYGEPGDLLAVGVQPTDWNAPRPITRIRHTEAANEYLFTDGMFTLNPTSGSNVYLALTRTSIGSSASNNAARFANTRHESWNARAAYRLHVGEALTFSAKAQYDEHLTLLNGGVLADFDPLSGTAPYLFPPEHDGTFSALAFDPKAAALVNPTMYTEGQHYHAEVGALLRWDPDSAQVTRLRLMVDSDVRRFRDDAAAVNPDLTLDMPQLNLTDHWTLSQTVLDHATHLGWAELVLQGAIGAYQLAMGGESLDDADVVAHAKGRLRLSLGPVSIAGYGRLDQRFGSSTVAFGVGAEIPIGPATLWGGTSFSARPRSPLEREYSGAHVVVLGDRSPDLDKYAVAEGGVRFSTGWFSFDLRGFARNESRYTNLSATAFSGSVLGRYVLFVEEIPGGLSHTVIGGSTDARLQLWKLHFDQRVSYCTDDQPDRSHVAPQLLYDAELYYRGGLIEGTLDLRAGVRYTHQSQFQPLLYHAQAGMFVASRIPHDALRSYTDVHRIDFFLFATIKQSATIHLLLHNLLDFRSITTEFHPMFDRALRLGVDWVFSD